VYDIVRDLHLSKNQFNFSLTDWKIDIYKSHTDVFDPEVQQGCFLTIAIYFCGLVSAAVSSS
jgi:hypothetical protein